MKRLLSILAIMTLNNCYSQEQELDIFQNDSIYSKNKISLRTMYSVNGSTLRKELVTHYNSTGQKIKQLWYWGEKDFHNVETFFYSNNGLISTLKDSSADGKIKTTTFYYHNNNLQKSVTLNGEDTTNFRTYPDKNITTICWYIQGKPYRFDTTIFEKENVKLKYFGSDKPPNSGRYIKGHYNPDRVIKWHYDFKNDFDEKGNLVKVSAKEKKPYKSFIRYIYDEKNLLIMKQKIDIIKKREAIQEQYSFTYE